MSTAEAVSKMLGAMILDASIEGKVSQSQLTIQVRPRKLDVCRIVVMPSTNVPTLTGDEFVEPLLDAMKRAVTKDEGSQFEVALSVGGPHARFVVVPEKMRFTWPKHSPLGSGGPERN